MSLEPLRTRGWVPRGFLARGTRGLLLGGVWLRCVTWRRAHELDEQLACGTDPMTSDELSLRVGQLGSARSRRRFACTLRGAVELAERPYDPVRMGPPMIRRTEIQENRELLLELAARLRTGRAPRRRRIGHHIAARRRRLEPAVLQGGMRLADGVRQPRIARTRAGPSSRRQRRLRLRAPAPGHASPPPAPCTPTSRHRCTNGGQGMSVQPSPGA